MHVALRALEPADLDLLYRWENNPEVWAVSNVYEPFSRHTLRQFIDNAGKADIYTNRQLRLMIDFVGETKQTIGCVDLFEFDPHNLRAGVGIVIGSIPHRRQGYALQALQLFHDYAFETLNLNQLFCNIAQTNTASLMLFAKAGYSISGTKKQWLRQGLGFVDVEFLQLINPANA